MNRLAPLLGVLLLVGCDHSTRDSGSTSSNKAATPGSASPAKVARSGSNSPNEAARWRWPADEDIRKLHSVKGLAKAEVLSVLGEPVRKETNAEGRERWYYPWLAAAFVDFDGDVAKSTFYTAGY